MQRVNHKFIVYTFDEDTTKSKAENANSIELTMDHIHGDTSFQPPTGVEEKTCEDHGDCNDVKSGEGVCDVSLLPHENCFYCDKTDDQPRCKPGRYRYFLGMRMGKKGPLDCAQ